MNRPLPLFRQLFGALGPLPHREALSQGSYPTHILRLIANELAPIPNYTLIAAMRSYQPELCARHASASRLRSEAQQVREERPDALALVRASFFSGSPESPESCIS